MPFVSSVQPYSIFHPLLPRHALTRYPLLEGKPKADWGLRATQLSRGVTHHSTWPSLLSSHVPIGLILAYVKRVVLNMAVCRGACVCMCLCWLWLWKGM